MTNTNDFTAAFTLDPKTVENGFKTWASFGERLSGISLDAAVKSTEIATTSAQETFANLRDLSVVRDDPAAYGQAFADLAQKQAELALRTAEAFGAVARTAQANATDLASKAGEEVNGTVAANANKAARKTSAAAKKAA